MKRQFAVVLVSTSLLLASCHSNLDQKTDRQTLHVAISPYQDLAMLTTYKSLGLDHKEGINLDLVTLQWEDVIPSLASAGRTVDIGFGSLIEFLTKYPRLNAGASDPLVYVYPTYVFKGGGFVSFNAKVPNLDDQPSPPPPDVVRKFFSFRLGAQKSSMFDMLLFAVSEQAGIQRTNLKVMDIGMADGLLAAEHGSLDAAAAGLTQRNEAIEKGGRVVLTMEKFGFADLTGLICKRSTLDARHADIEKLVRIWFQCVNFVYSDLDKNSSIPIQYLTQKSSTQYTPASYKRALEAEYLPRTLQDANRDLIADSGQYSIHRISDTTIKYLLKLGIVATPPPLPSPIEVR